MARILSKNILCLLAATSGCFFSSKFNNNKTFYQFEIIRTEKLKYGTDEDPETSIEENGICDPQEKLSPNNEYEQYLKTIREESKQGLIRRAAFEEARNYFATISYDEYDDYRNSRKANVYIVANDKKTCDDLRVRYQVMLEKLFEKKTK